MGAFKNGGLYLKNKSDLIAPDTNHTVLYANSDGTLRFIEDDTVEYILATTGYVDTAVITAHGDLSGLGDDDHTQYLLANGSRDISGSLIPSTSGTLSLGTSGKPFKDLYLLESSMYLGANKLSVNNGSLELNDSSVGGGGSPTGLQSTQVFTASGTWNRPAGVNLIRVITIGGGGGGGGAATGFAQTGYPGGSGSFSSILIDVSAISSETVTIGAGGSGGAGSATGHGSNGGTSTFGAHTSCAGGSGGSGSGGAGAYGPGGALPTLGDYKAGGTGGIKGTALGVSGGSYLGGGVAVASGSNGAAGGANTGAGGGAGSSNNNGSKTGGAGAAGIIIVEEYIK